MNKNHLKHLISMLQGIARSRNLCSWARHVREVGKVGEGRDTQERDRRKSGRFLFKGICNPPLPLLRARRGSRPTRLVLPLGYVS